MNKHVLGICLGAQLIGEAFGAKHEHSPQREIGVFNIFLTENAQSAKFFKDLPTRFQVGHWHGDMPGLSEHAEVLAYSEGCPRQIVRYTERVYAFQCHLEFTSDSVKNMIHHCHHELTAYLGMPYIQTAEMLEQYDYTAMNNILFKFLDYYLI